MSYRVESRSQPRRDLAVVKFSAAAPEVAQRIGAAFGAVQAYLAKAGVQSEGPAIGVYTPGPERFEVAAGFVVQAAVPGDGNVMPSELPACEAAVTTHVGSYASLPAAYEAIQSWMRENRREPSEVMWEEYWSGPKTPEEEARTVVVWPVKARAEADT